METLARLGVAGEHSADWNCRCSKSGLRLTRGGNEV
jgi:hypothetical protein